MKTNKLSSGSFKPGKLHPRYISDEQLINKVNNLDLRGLKATGKIEMIEQGQKKVRVKHIEMLCSYCNKIKMVNVSNLIRGKAKGCRCSMNIKHGANCRTNNKNEKAGIFGDRYDAMYQRCNNPASKYYPRYGGRGIKLGISRAKFIEHCMQKTMHLSVAQIRKLQIDRIDNSYGYVKGNMRLISQQKNLTNTDRNHYYVYKDKAILSQHLWHFLKRDYQDFSLSLKRTAVLAQDGKTVEYILQVPSKPKRTLASETRVVNQAIIALYDEEYVIM